MPIYEYRCSSCEQTFEQRRPMSQATDPAACPTCMSASPRAISRLARVSRGDGSGGEDDGGAEAISQGGSDFYTGGHGHSHGPMGHGL